LNKIIIYNQRKFSSGNLDKNKLWDFFLGDIWKKKILLKRGEKTKNFF